MFRIKICGVTRVEDALMAVEAGAEALGVNFYPQSPRCVSAQTAQAIVRSLPPEVAKVGVFVNAPASQIATLVEQLGLDLIQLHGDEPPEFLPQWAGTPIIKALRLGPERLAGVVAYLARCRELGSVPAMCLIDSYLKGRYGGTGQVADWAALREYGGERWHPPLVLAGGLNPQNVAEAIRLVRPYAVDTSSGVERSPGLKDPLLVRQFVAAARHAFAQL